MVFKSFFPCPKFGLQRVILEFNGIFGHQFVPYDLPWVVLNTKSRTFFQRLVHARRQCLNLMKSNLSQFIEG